MAVRLEKRLNPSKSASYLNPVFSVMLALLFCAVFLTLTGRDAAEVYSAMLEGAFGSVYGLSETAVKAIPLALCALGISLAFRMQLWNIGAEGQFYMGAFASSWLPLTFPEIPAMIMLPAMLLLGMAAGAFWGLIPGYLRAKWRVNEIITSLMLNYIGILWVSHLVYGVWKDPQGMNFPLSAQFPDAAMLPTLADTRIHAGALLVQVFAVLFTVLFNRSRWGYEIKVIGASEPAARYAGMDINRNICLVMLVSGALCGLAGMTEVSGIVGRLQPGLSPGYGYTAIIVAWLAKLHPFAIVVVSILFGALQVGGYFVQTMGVPATVAAMLQGAILFFVVGGEVFTTYRIRITSRKGAGAADA